MKTLKKFVDKMKTDTYNKSTVWFLSTPIQSSHNVQPPFGVVFFLPFDDNL